MKEIIDALHKLRRSWAKKKPPVKMYIFQEFNISSHFATSGISNIINRFLNAFVEALNTCARLPKYILVIPDGDIASRFCKEPNPSIMMGAALHTIIKNMDIYIHRRQLDLIDKKPGAAIEDNFPRIIWVRMLKRPTYVGGEKFTLRGKFNTILEERLGDGLADTHRIMSIDVSTENFNHVGGLTAEGEKMFWKEVNSAIKKVNVNAITLLPRKPQHQQTKEKNMEPQHKRKLPTPPPRAHSKDQNPSNRSSKRPWSRSRYDDHHDCKCQENDRRQCVRDYERDTKHRKRNNSENRDNLCHRHRHDGIVPAHYN